MQSITITSFDEAETIEGLLRVAVNVVQGSDEAQTRKIRKTAMEICLQLIDIQEFYKAEEVEPNG